MSQPEDSAANSLGLDLNSLKIVDDPSPPVKQEHDKPEGVTETSFKSPLNVSTSKDDLNVVEGDQKVASTPTKEKKKPYINPDRVKTGGAQRDKLTEEQLTERMVRIREQNEKIKLRREDVKKDEDEFRKMQEAERVRQAKTKKVQEDVNRTREQNARRKMEKIESREWDSGKQGGSWKDARAANPDSNAGPSERPPPQKIGIRGGISGSGRGRGKPNPSPNTEKPPEQNVPSSATS